MSTVSTAPRSIFARLFPKNSPERFSRTAASRQLSDEAQRTIAATASVPPVLSGMAWLGRLARETAVRG